MNVLQNLKTFAETADRRQVGLLAMTLLMLPGFVAAINAPTAGFAYDVYDVVVVQILQGPIGFVGGLATIILGASQLMKNWMVAILGVVAGTVIIKADTITASLGALTSAL